MEAKMDTPKPRGRPKGSRNKRLRLAVASVREICEDGRFNPAQKLVQIANGKDTTQAWDKADRLKATMWLAESIHGKRGLMQDADNDEPRNYEIVFVEDSNEFIPPDSFRADRATDITLQGETSTGVAALTDGSQPVRSAGLSPEDG